MIDYFIDFTMNAIVFVAALTFWGILFGIVAVVYMILMGKL